MAVWVGASVAAHLAVHGVVNGWQVTLVFFLAINLLIYIRGISLGLAIDVGNAWSTLVPSLFFLVGMTTGMVSPVLLGLVGALLFYRKSNCTCVYFFQYVFNRRYRGHPQQ